MTLNLPSFLAQASQFRHHALLLVNRRFGEEGLSEKAFRGIALTYCGIQLPDCDPEQFWEEIARHPDLVVVDRERNQLRLEELSTLRKVAFYPPNLSRRRLFFIDRAERLNPNAANSLLKTLEEPNIQALFLFTARSVSGVLPTISSRCQKVPFCEEVAPSKHASQLFEPEDWAALRERFGVVRAAAPVVTASFWEKPPAKVSARSVSGCLDFALAIGKKYDASVLQDGLAALVAEMFSDNPIVARYVVNDLVEWKNATAMHPSSELWLSRIFFKLGGLSG